MQDASSFSAIPPRTGFTRDVVRPIRTLFAMNSNGQIVFGAKTDDYRPQIAHSDTTGESPTDAIPPDATTDGGAA